MSSEQHSQGELFETKIVFNAPDPVISAKTEYYDTSKPVFPDPQSKTRKQPTESASQVEKSNTTALELLQLVVNGVSDISQRGGFKRATMQRVQESANKRHITPKQALEQADRNADNIRSDTKVYYDKLRDIAQQAITFTSLFTSDLRGIRPASFDEFAGRVSGPDHKNLRRSIRRGRKWRARDTDLILHTPDGRRFSELVNQPTGHKAISKNRYLSLPSMIMAEKYSESKSKQESLDKVMSNTWRDLNANYFGHPGQVLMSAADRSSIVWTPSGYKRDLREGDASEGSSEYSHRLAGKIKHLQNRRNMLIADKHKLQTVLPIMDGVVIHGNDTKARKDAATKLHDAHEVMNREIDLMAEVRGWNEDRTTAIKKRLDNILLRGKLPDGSDVSRRDSWLEAINAVSQHLARQADIFNKNINQLNK